MAFLSAECLSVKLVNWAFREQGDLGMFRVCAHNEILNDRTTPNRTKSPECEKLNSPCAPPRQTKRGRCSVSPLLKAAGSGKARLGIRISYGIHGTSWLIHGFRETLCNFGFPV